MKYKRKDTAGEASDFLPPFPKIETKVDLLECKKDQLSKTIRFLEAHRFCDSATRLEAHLLSIALDKIISDAELDLQKYPAHGNKIVKNAVEFITNSIERKIRELIQHELERNSGDIEARCKHIAENATEDWLAIAAQKIPIELENELQKITDLYNKNEIASTEISPYDLFEALKTAFARKECIEGLTWIVEYSADPEQPKFKAGSRKLTLANAIVNAVAESKAPLKNTVKTVAAELGVTEDTVKEIIREVAYAAYDGHENIKRKQEEFIPWEVSRLSVEERMPDYRKTPSSLNDEIRKFYFVIYSADLKSQLLPMSRIRPLIDPDKCRKTAYKYLRFPEERDKQDIIDAYAPLPAEEIAKAVDKLLVLMSNTVEVKAQDMDAHPVRAVSWFKQRKGRITEWEKEKIGKAPPEKLAELRRIQLRYDLLYEEAVCEFTKQVAELREFIRIYGSEINPEFKSIIKEAFGFDPVTGEDIIPNTQQVDRYLSSLNKTLDRWNDLGKEFRKVPYVLERAIKNKYVFGGGIRLSEAERKIIDSISRMALGSKEVEEQITLLETFQKVRKDVENRLRSIAEHMQNGKIRYAQAMEMRNKHLCEFLPHK